jgi:hypothetical protein
MRSTIRRFTTALIVAAIATTICTTATPAAGQAPAESDQARESRLALSGDSLQKAAARSPRFAGVRVSDDRTRIDLYATDVEDPEIKNAARDHARGSQVRILHAPTALGDMEALRERISDDSTSWASQGLQLVHWGPNVAANKVKIGLADYTEPDAQKLRDKYGPAVVVAPATPATDGASRLVDNSPWNGGDNTAMDNGGDCSTGPAVKSASGKTYLLSAGHCYITGFGNTAAWTGNYIYRTFNGSHNLTGDNPRLMGNAAAERVDMGYDAALIDTSASGLAWRTAAPADQGTAVAQKQEFASTENISVCVSGAFSGERCGAVVTDVDVVVTSSGVRKIHSVIATHPTGALMAGNGDSGGPVYTVQSTGLFMTGMYHAFQDQADCTRSAFPGRRCGSTYYYHNLSSVMNHRGVTLVKR